MKEVTEEGEMHYLRWRLSSLVSSAGFWCGRAYWRVSGLLEKIPGFREGYEEAEDRQIARYMHDEDRWRKSDEGT
jgi:hypothetical protein